MLTLKPLALLGKFWQEKSLSLIFRWSLTFIIFQVGLILFKYGNLPQQVPFYYSLPWGESQLAPVDYLFMLPGISFLILVINNFSAAVLLPKVRLLSLLLSIFSLICSLFLFYSLFKIISLIS